MALVPDVVQGIFSALCLIDSLHDIVVNWDTLLKCRVNKEWLEVFEHFLHLLMNHLQMNFGVDEPLTHMCMGNITLTYNKTLESINSRTKRMESVLSSRWNYDCKSVINWTPSHSLFNRNTSWLHTNFEIQKWRDSASTISFCRGADFIYQDFMIISVKTKVAAYIGNTLIRNSEREGLSILAINTMKQKAPLLYTFPSNKYDNCVCLHDIDETLKEVFGRIGYCPRDVIMRLLPVDSK